MNDPVENGEWKDAAACDGAGAAEATLRLIARLPAPVGLEERVRAGLAARPRGGRVLAWPAVLSLESGWMRAAAAAAIMFVVAGGGWGVYSRMEQRQPPRVIVLAPRGPAQGGFASAGAVRTPQTLNGPVVAHPAAALAEGGKDAAKGVAPVVPKKKGRVQPSEAGSAKSQDAVPQSK